jgi:hypothetical protein
MQKQNNINLNSRPTCIHKRYTKFHIASSKSLSIDNSNEHQPAIGTKLLDAGRARLVRSRPERSILARTTGEKYKDCMEITWGLCGDTVKKALNKPDNIKRSKPSAPP